VTASTPGQPPLPASDPVPLREWHDMSSAERQQAWAELVAWVTWLHDRYELGSRPGLPACWAEHPGLIEELAALKAWRDEIWSSGLPPSGQAARYWHGELRHVINAAETMYAPGCSAGHRTAGHLAASDQALQERWAAADPLARIPAALHGQPHQPGSPRTRDGIISEQAMTSYLAAGTARQLGQQLPGYARYAGHWWHHTPGGWQQVTDPALAARLSQHAGPAQSSDTAVASTEQPPAQPGPDDGPHPSTGA
jgi:hypothetical protein